MLVDDSEENRQLIQLFLKNFPIRLRFACDGQEAFELFQLEKFDLILMDIQMPVMDGLTSTQLIREFEKNKKMFPTPIVALSAYAMQSDRDKALEAGCNAHLAKPLRKAILLKTIHEVLSSSSAHLNQDT